MIHQLLLKRQSKDRVSSFGIGKTTWGKQKNNLMPELLTIQTPERRHCFNLHQASVKGVYQELGGDVEGSLDKFIKKVIRKLRNRGDTSHETLDYFSVNNLKLGRFYLLPKIHKRLHDVPRRPVISNSGFHIENISSFIGYHLKPLAQNVKSYIQ